MIPYRLNSGEKIRFLLGMWALENNGGEWFLKSAKEWLDDGKISNRRYTHMWAVHMTTVAEIAGVAIGLAAFIKAMAWAGKSQKYDSHSEAANSQDVWVKAYEYQSESDKANGGG